MTVLKLERERGRGGGGGVGLIVSTVGLFCMVSSGCVVAKWLRSEHRKPAIPAKPQNENVKTNRTK